MLNKHFGLLRLWPVLLLLVVGPLPAETETAVETEAGAVVETAAGEMVESEAGQAVETETGAEAAAQAEAARGIEVVAELAQGPGNLTVTPDGRILVSLHQFFETDMRVAEVMPDGELVPFPSESWAVGFQSRLALSTVLGIQSDPEGVVWMLDNGMRDGMTPRLVGWDTRSDRLERLITLAQPATAPNSFVNDLAVDRTHHAVYIADPAGSNNAALIVVDLKTGTARRVLEGHPSVVPEDIDLVIDDRPVEIRQADGSTVRPRIGVNPIALDHDNEWLYFGPMHGTSLYRIRTRHLRDHILDEEGRLAGLVERHGDKVISDGSSVDQAGNVYITDLAGHAVGVTDPDGGYRVLVSDPRLAWPDALSFGPDGMLYVAANQLHRTARLNAGTDETQPPFLILRVDPLAEGVVGR
jgi:sugar lactone lactonase YvrE